MQSRRPKMLRFFLVALTGLALTGCAGMGRLMSYGMDQAHGQVRVGSEGFNVWVHPSDNTIIVQERFGGAIAGAFVEGASFNLVESSPPKDIARHAGAVFLSRFGCRAHEAITLEDITTEVVFTCEGEARPHRVEPRSVCSTSPLSAVNYDDPHSFEWVAC